MATKKNTHPSSGTDLPVLVELSSLLGSLKLNSTFVVLATADATKFQQKETAIFAKLHARPGKAVRRFI